MALKEREEKEVREEGEKEGEGEERGLESQALAGGGWLHQVVCLMGPPRDSAGVSW